MFMCVEMFAPLSGRAPCLVKFVLFCVSLLARLKVFFVRVVVCCCCCCVWFAFEMC